MSIRLSFSISIKRIYLNVDIIGFVRKVYRKIFM